LPGSRRVFVCASARWFQRAGLSVQQRALAAEGFSAVAVPRLRSAHSALLDSGTALLLPAARCWTRNGCEKVPNRGASLVVHARVANS